jgi:hypothetical protein
MFQRIDHVPLIKPYLIAVQNVRNKMSALRLV